MVKDKLLTAFFSICFAVCFIAINQVLISDAEAQAYCSASSNNSNYEWISSVQVGNLNNPSAPSKYSNFLSQTAFLTQGKSVNYTLTPGFMNGSYSENWKLFIDFNKNGSFNDAGEQMVSNTSNKAVTGNFLVPNDALPGQTRMRVVMMWGAPPASCGAFNYGEVEDYSVTIEPDADQTDLAEPTDLDEMGLHTVHRTTNKVLAATVVEDTSYGATLRHYTYSYDGGVADSGRTQIYTSKSFPADANINQVVVTNTTTNKVIAKSDCAKYPINISCYAYIEVVLGLENRVLNSYSVVYKNSNDSTVLSYEFNFTLASAVLKR